MFCLLLSNSLFLTADGRVLSCGWGADGQTGRGHFDSTSDVAEVRGELEGENVVKVATSADCVLALTGEDCCLAKR
jgi:hypothetical protein